ncbi:MAG: DUF4446 family protein [Gaiellales bacterium]
MSSDTAFAVAVASAAASVLLLGLTVWLFVQLRRLRRAQKLVLGSDQQDLVEYAVGLLARVEHVETRADAVEAALQAAGRRLDQGLERRALVRYDALEGSGGKQSVSIALMDASGSGLVISAIQDREYARLYVKELRNGSSDLELSPEERRAVDAAGQSRDAKVG